VGRSSCDGAACQRLPSHALCPNRYAVYKHHRPECAARQQFAMAALMSVALQAAAAIRDYHRQTQNSREAAGVGHERAVLSGLRLL